MHDDDKPVGRVLSRREAITLLGAGGMGLLATRIGAQSEAGSPHLPSPYVPLPACVVRPEQTEGPYFVDERLERSDIRSDPASGVISEGVPLALAFTVSRVASGGCLPLAGAIVDIWHCDAAGAYSDVDAGGPGGRGGPPPGRDAPKSGRGGPPQGRGGRMGRGGAASAMASTVGKKFLRGYQVTDANGLVRFSTIYPGWYEGRAVHIHFKIRTSFAAQAREFTSQLYFDDALNAQVFSQAPYSTKGVDGLVLNDRDGIFQDGGRQLLLDARSSGAGYTAAFDVALTDV